MTKWHAYVAHMAKHMKMVGGPRPGPLGLPPKSGAVYKLRKLGALAFIVFE